MMLLKHEKIMLKTQQIMKMIISQRFFNGSGDDYVYGIDFDTKNKRFKSLKQDNDRS